MTARPAGPTRTPRSAPGRVLAVVVGAVALLAVVAGVISALSDDSVYDRSTPEGAVQVYVTAVIDGDHGTAAELLDEEGSCELSDLDESWVPEETRVVLRGTSLDGDRADVWVGIARSSSGELFGGSEQFEGHTFRLAGGPGEWRIIGRPWPLYSCDGKGVS